ncbi:MAG: hypothetical protein ACTSXA_13705 [Candidatus Heimdallarchaeota archaeon]
MSFGSVMLGMLIGGIVSSGAIIGITFLGTLVPWWALLLIGVGGSLIGGLLAGILAKGAGAGALAGFLSGLIVFIAVFLFAWLYYKATITNYIASLGDIGLAVEALLGELGLAGTPAGDQLALAITDYLSQVGDVNALIAQYFPIFGLIIGGVFGGVAAITNLFAGLIGGLFTRKKNENYDSYY